MIFKVSPIAANIATDANTDSGIEIAMISVERQLPKNNKIMTLVSRAATAPSNTTLLIAPRTNTD